MIIQTFKNFVRVGNILTNLIYLLKFLELKSYISFYLSLQKCDFRCYISFLNNNFCQLFFYYETIRYILKNIMVSFTEYIIKKTRPQKYII